MQSFTAVMLRKHIHPYGIGNAPVNILPAQGGGGLTQGNLTS